MWPVISEMVERRSLVFRIICVVTRWHIGLKFQNHRCSVAHSYSNSMDKQQVIDGKQLIIMYVTALCVRVSVCKSQYGIREYSCMDAFSEIVALCLIHYIRYRHLMFRYWYPRSGWGEKKSRHLSSYHLYLVVCFVPEAGEGQARLWTSVPPWSSFCYLGPHI